MQSGNGFAEESAPALRLLDRPSPNHGPRRGGALPDMVVLHYTAMEGAEAALDRLADPAAEVSAHYVLGETGEVWAMVPEARRAWHAGAAAWGGVGDVNSRSIGIEMVNPGPEAAGGMPPFPEPQMRALEKLLRAILLRHAIPPERVVGHACVAPLRKADPGRKLDWRRLARAGLAVWEEPGPPEAGGAADPAAFRRAARRFGYPLGLRGGWDDEAAAVWRAFAARFRPGEAARGIGPHAAGVAQLARLAGRWPAHPAAAAE